MSGSNRRQRRRRYDWTPIRQAREIEGKSFADLSREFGPNKDTIRGRAKRENWRDPVEVRSDLSRACVDEILRRFIAREADAIFDNRTRVHAIDARILGRVENRLDEIDAGISPAEGGEALELRRLALVTSTVEMIDARLADLNSAEGWRSAGEIGSDDAESTFDEVLRLLDELDETSTLKC